MAKKIILAYSGGLDTSVAIKWLIDKGFEVVAFLADVGQGEDFKELEKRALATGASKVYIEDLKDEFIGDFVFPSLRANAIYEGKYLLATALSRPLIAKKLVEAAKRENAHYVAHGCTGKGNDQVRFELTIALLDKNLEIVAPAREWEFKSRDEQIKYAKQHNIPIDADKKKPYSIDKNLWGISIECGVLEDPWIEPPEDAYQLTRPALSCPDKATYIEIYFEKGIPKRLNGKLMEPLEIIKRLNDMGAKNGVGRSDLIEDRLVGIKSREVYEAPAGNILYNAHKELENLTLDREMIYFKEIISQKYSQLVYNGLWFTQLKAAIDKFVEHTQEYVTGEIRVKLFKGSCICVGRNSRYSLYKKEQATYGPLSQFDQKKAEGFIKIFGMPFIDEARMPAVLAKEEAQPPTVAVRKEAKPKTKVRPKKKAAAKKKQAKEKAKKKGKR